MPALIDETYGKCSLCPRSCGADRYRGRGFCGAGAVPRIALAALHRWEEPCICGNFGDEAAAPGTGAVFFSHCTLGCVYCQNYELSALGKGIETDAEKLAEIYLRLQDEGAVSLDLVTPTHFLPDVLKSLDIAKNRLCIPVVYNCGGYERPETVRMLDGYVDIYLPDIKYDSPELSGEYSSAADYSLYAFEAVREMIRQTGSPDIDESTGLMRKGTIIRHMVLPGCRRDSLRILDRIKKELPGGKYLVSIMSQYTPFYKAEQIKALNRRVTTFEYESVLKHAAELGLDGYMQEKSSAKKEYTPVFDLSGI